MSVRVVQLSSGRVECAVAVVDGSILRFVAAYPTLFDVAQAAIHRGASLESMLLDNLSGESLSYDDVYSGSSEWHMRTPFHHPSDFSRCLVTGTGLTHRKSADNRNSMHAEGESSVALTDSMQMYLWGLDGGRPDDGKIGVAPEWFYKGRGDIVRAHNELLHVPNYAADGGEEAEIAGIYLIGEDGRVFRVGFAAGNEFSDHVTESRNYLYLAPSKLRECSLGPEIVIGQELAEAVGKAAILRNGVEIWSQEISSGGDALTHTLTNLEHHHFKYQAHRIPGDVHIHFFGTPGFSFGSGVTMQDGDLMQVCFAGYGRALVNPIAVDRTEPSLVTVTNL